MPEEWTMTEETSYQPALLGSPPTVSEVFGQLGFLQNFFTTQVIDKPVWIIFKELCVFMV